MPKLVIRNLTLAGVALVWSLAAWADGMPSAPAPIEAEEPAAIVPVPEPKDAAPATTATPPAAIAVPENGAIATVDTDETPAEDSRRAVERGTGIFINESAASRRPPDPAQGGDVVFNFEGESLQAVIKAILGDLLGQNYVVAPGVQGQVTFATAKPISMDQAMGVLEMLLAWNNATLQRWSLHGAAGVAGDSRQPDPAHRTGAGSAGL